MKARERLRNGKERENKRGSVKTKREEMQWKEGEEEMSGRKGGWEKCKMKEKSMNEKWGQRGRSRGKGKRNYRVRRIIPSICELIFSGCSPGSCHL